MKSVVVCFTVGSVAALASTVALHAQEPDVNCPCSVYKNERREDGTGLYLVTGSNAASEGPVVAFRFDDEREFAATFATHGSDGRYRLAMRGHSLETNEAGTPHCQAEVRVIGEDRIMVRELSGVDFCVPLGFGGAFDKVRAALTIEGVLAD